MEEVRLIIENKDLDLLDAILPRIKTFTLRATESVSMLQMSSKQYKVLEKFFIRCNIFLPFICAKLNG